MSQNSLPLEKGQQSLYQVSFTFNIACSHRIPRLRVERVGMDFDSKSQFSINLAGLIWIKIHHIFFSPGLLVSLNFLNRLLQLVQQLFITVGTWNVS